MTSTKDICEPLCILCTFSIDWTSMAVVPPPPPPPPPSVGVPVNTHDSTLLQSTDLWKRIVRGEMILNIVQQVEDVEIPPLILGDGAFPLWTFMLKPYRDALLPHDKRYFNYRNSRARLVTEGAFGRLKIRFRVFFRKFGRKLSSFMA